MLHVFSIGLQIFDEPLHLFPGALRVLPFSVKNHSVSVYLGNDQHACFRTLFARFFPAFTPFLRGFARFAFFCKKKEPHQLRLFNQI
jgi:hypothetical protein